MHFRQAAALSKETLGLAHNFQGVAEVAVPRTTDYTDDGQASGGGFRAGPGRKSHGFLGQLWSRLALQRNGR
jgi:hypothetical protein